MKKLLILSLSLISFFGYSQTLIDPTLTPTTARINAALSDAVATSGTDTYTGTKSGLTNVSGKAYSVTFGTANTTTSTFNLNGSGAVTIRKFESGSLVNLVAGDISAGETKRLRYNGTYLVIEGGSGSGGITDLTGDVTASGTGSVVATLAPGVIVDADVNASAAIAGTKIANTPAGNIAATTVQAAINELDTEKQATLISGTSIKTINGSTILGSGDLSVGGSTPGGSNTQVQFNDASSFGGDSGLTYNKTTDVLTVSTTKSGTLTAVTADTTHWYGTSIAAGSSSTVTTKRYTYLAAQGLQTVESNHGLGGYSLQKPSGYGGASFMNSYLTTIKPATSGAKFIFLAWGENDANNQHLGVSGFSTAQFETDYQTVVNFCLSKGYTSSNIVIISPFWFATTTTPLVTQQAYVTSAQTIATANSLKFIDVFTLGAAYGLYIQAGDAKHPNDYGHSLYAETILQSMKAFNNVHDNSQRMAVNGVGEFQSLKIVNADLASDNAHVAMINPDNSITKISPDRWIKSYGTDPGTGFRNTGNIWNDGLIYSNSVIRGSTGAFTGASWAYNNALLTSGVNTMMIGVQSNQGYLWCYDGTTHRSIRTNELGGNFIVGLSTEVSGVKLQATGTAFVSQRLRVGSATAPVNAFLDVAPGGSSSTLIPIKFNTFLLTTTAASGTGSTATLTFTAQSYAPYAVGTTIVVSGVTPSGYNGTYTVTACTTTTVSFASSTTGSQTVAGQIKMGLLGTIQAGAVEYDASNYVSNNALNRMAIGGKIAGFFSGVSNTSTTETDLFTYTTKANTLFEDDEELEFKGGGTFNDATATPELKFYFAGTSIGATTALTLTGTGSFTWAISVKRTGATTASAIVEFKTSSSATTTYINQTDLTGLTLTGTNIIKVTGTATGGTGGTGDITAKHGKIIWWPAAKN